MIKRWSSREGRDRRHALAVALRRAGRAAPAGARRARELGAVLPAGQARIGAARPRLGVALLAGAARDARARVAYTRRGYSNQVPSNSNRVPWKFLCQTNKASVLF